MSSEPGWEGATTTMGSASAEPPAEGATTTGARFPPLDFRGRRFDLVLDVVVGLMLVGTLGGGYLTIVLQAPTLPRESSTPAVQVDGGSGTPNAPYPPAVTRDAPIQQVPVTPRTRDVVPPPEKNTAN
ncbi:MAG: hypothetical protein H6983_04225 [Ectothiorhodospiraceae bacterium]|nr:hypothetical protein [Ectothiorhodospiraceae bacterium]